MHRRWFTPTNPHSLEGIMKRSLLSGANWLTLTGKVPGPIIAKLQSVSRVSSYRSVGRMRQTFTINSQSTEFVNIIGSTLLAWRKPELTAVVIQRIIHQANLKRHSTIGCKLLTQIADAIPDDQMEVVLKWLLKSATSQPQSQSGKSLIGASWETI